MQACMGVAPDAWHAVHAAIMSTRVSAANMAQVIGKGGTNPVGQTGWLLY